MKRRKVRGWADQQVNDWDESYDLDESSGTGRVIALIALLAVPVILGLACWLLGGAFKDLVDSFGKTLGGFGN